LAATGPSIALIGVLADFGIFWSMSALPARHRRRGWRHPCAGSPPAASWRRRAGGVVLAA